MPDPSGEPLSPTRQSSGAPPPVASTGEVSHLSPAPRVHPPNIRQPREEKTPKPAPPPPKSLSEVLEWLRLYGHVDVVPADDPNEPAQTKRSARSLLPKEQRKFHKFDPEHPDPQLAAVRGIRSFQGEEAHFGAAFAGDAAFPGEHPRGITSDQIAAIRRFRREVPERNPWLAVGIGSLAFLLTTGAFLAGHATAPKLFVAGHAPAVAPSLKSAPDNEVASLSADVLQLIDQAMAAEAAKNYAKAIALLEQAQRDAGHIYGLNYRLAALCREANEMPRVLPLLNLSIAQGEEVAACYNLRGTFSNQYERTAQGPGDLEKATQLDPFNARYLFGWGEALRRAGKLQSALAQLHRAVDRLQEPALLPSYALKVRLTQLALDQENSFAAELTAKLKLIPPPTDWLLTAAAVEMRHGNFSAAAEDLARIRALIGAGETTLLLQDVYFENFAREKELSEFFEGPAASASSAALTLP